MAGTQLGADKLQGDDNPPVELNADGKVVGEGQDVAGGPGDYSVERVEKVYR